MNSSRVSEILRRRTNYYESLSDADLAADILELSEACAVDPASATTRHSRASHHLRIAQTEQKRRSSRRRPVVRLTQDLLPVDGQPRSDAAEHALRLARYDSREQTYGVNLALVGDRLVQDFARLLSSHRRRLDGLGSVSVEAWHGTPDGVHIIVHEAEERSR